VVADETDGTSVALPVTDDRQAVADKNRSATAKNNLNVFIPVFSSL
jgi:hypothetical protein